jgi:hypothetical protein
MGLNNLTETGTINYSTSSTRCAFGSCAQLAASSYLATGNMNYPNIPASTYPSQTECFGWRSNNDSYGKYMGLFSIGAGGGLGQGRFIYIYGDSPGLETLSMGVWGQTVGMGIAANYVALNYYSGLVATSNISGEMNVSYARNVTTTAAPNTPTPQIIYIGKVGFSADTWQPTGTGAIDECRLWNITIEDVTASDRRFNITFQNFKGTAGFGNLGAVEYGSPSNVTNPVLAPIPAYANSTINLSVNLTYTNATATGTVNWILYANGSAYASGSNASVAVSTNTTLKQYAGVFGFNTSLILYANATMSDGGVLTGNNSSLLNISNSVPVINSVWIQNNASLFGGQTTLTGAVNVSDADSQPLSINYSWMKNGANQTALAGNTSVSNNGLSLFNTTAPAMTIGDNWSLVVYATDGVTASSTRNTSNFTVKNITIVLNYTPQQYDTQSYVATAWFPINATITDANATFTSGGISAFVTKTVNANNISFTATSSPSAPVFNSTSNNTWVFTFASDGGLFAYTSNYSIQAVIGGFYVCNATIPNNTINYTFYDASTIATLNATITSQFNFNKANGSAMTQTFTGTNTTVYVCVLGENITATIIESINSTGYTSLNTNEFARSYILTLISLRYGLVNSSSSAYYTFIVQNIYAAPMSGANIIGYHYTPSNNTWAPVQTSVTDSTGSAIFALIPGDLYNFSITASGYNGMNYALTPGTTYTIIVQLSQNVTPMPITQAWNTTGANIIPTPGYYNTTQTITYTVANSNSSVQYFSMAIIYNGSTVVYNQTSANASGGTLAFPATGNGTYNVYTCFKIKGIQDYCNAPSYLYYIHTNSTGIVNIKFMMASGDVVSGWTFYLIIFVLAVITGVALSGLGPGASIFGAMVVLTALTFFAPSNMVIFSIVTPYIATFILDLVGIAALYITSYGG